MKRSIILIAILVFMTSCKTVDRAPPTDHGLLRELEQVRIELNLALERAGLLEANLNKISQIVWNQDTRLIELNRLLNQSGGTPQELLQRQYLINTLVMELIESYNLLIEYLGYNPILEGIK